MTSPKAPLRLTSSFKNAMPGLVAFVVLLAASPSYAITVTPSPVAFGNVPVGSFQTRIATVKNSTATKLILTAAALTGTGYSLAYQPVFPYTVDPGGYVNLKVKFMPTAAGYDEGHLTVYYNHLRGGRWVWASSTVGMRGTGVRVVGSLSASPTSLGFGTVQLSLGKSLSETITNSGSTAITISKVNTTGVGFSFSGIMLPVTLSRKQSATLTVKFQPATAGSVSGKLTIDSNASNSTLSVPLSGTGGTPGQLALLPSSINFGSVAVGNHKTQTGSVTASKGVVVISAATPSGPEFSVSGISFPLTLNSGQSASFVLTFAPSTSGTATANIRWLSSASNSPMNQSLTGTGTGTAAYSVALSWNASTSVNIVGYNVFRGQHSGGPYARINQALIAGTQDVDYNVQSGNTYYYVVTAVDSAGGQSAYSGQVQAVIP